MIDDNTGIAELQPSTLQVIIRDNEVWIIGLNPGEQFTVYNMQGKAVCRQIAQSATEEYIRLSAHGVYILTAGNRKVKVVY